MNKEQFLQALAQSLWQLEDSEREKFIEFYSEMIDDRMEDGMSEADAVAALGDLEQIAESALSGSDAGAARQTAPVPVAVPHSNAESARPFVGEIHSLSFDCADARVRIQQGVLPNDAVARIDCDPPQAFESALNDGTLTIRRRASGKRSLLSDLFSSFGMSQCSCTLTLSEPQLRHGRIRTNSGDVTIEGIDFSEALEVFTCSGTTELGHLSIGGNLSVCTASGEQHLEDLRCGKNLTVSGASGDIQLDRLQLDGNLSMNTGSGDLSLRSIRTGGCLSLTSSSGGIGLIDAQIEGFVKLHTTSGDIDVQTLSCADAVSLHSTSGDIEADQCRATGDLLAECASGDIQLTGLHCDGNSLVKAISGDIELENGQYNGALNIRDTSGDLNLSDICAAKDIVLDTNTGDVELSHVDCGGLRISTNTGDVSGTLVDSGDGYRFQVGSKHGDISVPSTNGTRIVEVRTSIGDVNLSLV